MSEVLDPSVPQDSVGKGILLACVLHFLQIPLIFALESASRFLPDTYRVGIVAFLFWGWGLTQFLYLGPAAWLAFRHGERDRGKGILIVAAIGLLIDGACDALLVFGR